MGNGRNGKRGRAGLDEAETARSVPDLSAGFGCNVLISWKDYNLCLVQRVPHVPSLQCPPSSISSSRCVLTLQLSHSHSLE